MAGRVKLQERSAHLFKMRNNHDSRTINVNFNQIQALKRRIATTMNEADSSCSIIARQTSIDENKPLSLHGRTLFKDEEMLMVDEYWVSLLLFRGLCTVC